MASKKELEADNAGLRKNVGRAVQELDQLSSDLAEIVGERNDGEAQALRILARRTRFVANELSEELRANEIDAETVGFLLRFFRHEYTRKAIGGLITGLAAKYGPELVDQADLALDAVDDVLGVLSSLGDATSVPPIRPSRSHAGTEQSGVSSSDDFRDDSGRPTAGDDRDSRSESIGERLGMAEERDEALPLTVVQGRGAVSEGTASITTEPASSEGRGTFTPPERGFAQARATVTPGSDSGDPAGEREPVEHDETIEDSVGVSDSVEPSVDATVFPETIRATTDFPPTTIGGDAIASEVGDGEAVDEQDVALPHIDNTVSGAGDLTDEPDVLAASGTVAPPPTARPDNATHGHTSSSPDVTTGDETEDGQS